MGEQPQTGDSICIRPAAPKANLKINGWLQRKYSLDLIAEY
jgi:hypothetical protein